MQCPDCGGPMWDNRPKKASGQYKANRSDFSCKDKDGCGKGVWIKEGEGAPVSNGNGAHASQSGSPSRPLGPLYNECLDFSAKACKHYFGEATTPADIIAAAATLFIQAARDGAPIRATKPIAAPEPPPPPPPKPEPVYEPLPF